MKDKKYDGDMASDRYFDKHLNNFLDEIQAFGMAYVDREPELSDAETASMLTGMIASSVFYAGMLEGIRCNGDFSQAVTNKVIIDTFRMGFETFKMPANAPPLSGHQKDPMFV